jgi:hypothetical protein
LFAGTAPRLELNLPLNQTPGGGARNAMTVIRAMKRLGIAAK